MSCPIGVELHSFEQRRFESGVLVHEHVHVHVYVYEHVYAGEDSAP